MFRCRIMALSGETVDLAGYFRDTLGHPAATEEISSPTDLARGQKFQAAAPRSSFHTAWATSGTRERKTISRSVPFTSRKRREKLLRCNQMA